MAISKPRKIIAFIVAAVSGFAVFGLFAKSRGRQRLYGCQCGDEACDCTGAEAEVHVHEPSVCRVPRVRKLGTRTAGVAEAELTDVTLSGIFERIKETSPSNESIARVILSLINLQNAVQPDAAIDVRNIHFMKSGKQNKMVIDLYTAGFGSPAYEGELQRLWDDIFLAENFWNADFVGVRVNVKDAASGASLETISCGFDDVRRYLLKETLLEEFQASWNRKKPNGGPNGATKKRNNTEGKKKDGRKRA